MMSNQVDCLINYSQTETLSLMLKNWKGLLISAKILKTKSSIQQIKVKEFQMLKSKLKNLNTFKIIWEIMQDWMNKQIIMSKNHRNIQIFHQLWICRVILLVSMDSCFSKARIDYFMSKSFLIHPIMIMNKIKKANRL